MREVVADVRRLRERGEKIAIATVVAARRSAPRPIGSKLVVSESGEMCGSVSGGCVEGAVVGEALEILAGRNEPRVVTFGYSDDEAFAVGLTCGGTIRLFIEALDW